jgi:tetratricopeptide (TPR) repeat protein
VLAALPARAQTTSPQAADAWQALQARDAERAEALFRRELTRTPSDPALHYGAGLAALLLGRTRDAARSLTRALELEPRLTEASLMLGEIQYREGDVDAAVRTYERASTLAPGDLEIRERLEAWRKEVATHRGLVTQNDGRFSILFEGRTDRALAEHAVKTLEAAYWRIAAALDSYPSDRITVTLYTEQQFRDLTNAPDWAAAIFDGRIRIPAAGALDRLEEFDRVLAHELTHAVVHMMAPRGVPVWLHEGLASYFEPRNRDEAVAFLKKSGLLPLERFVNGFSRLSGRDIAIGYMESFVLTDLIVKRVGTQMGIVLHSLNRGQSFETSLGLVGVSLADLEADLTRVFGQSFNH